MSLAQFRHRFLKTVLNKTSFRVILLHKIEAHRAKTGGIEGTVAREEGQGGELFFVIAGAVSAEIADEEDGHQIGDANLHEFAARYRAGALDGSSSRR